MKRMEHLLTGLLVIQLILVGCTGNQPAGKTESGQEKSAVAADSVAVGRETSLLLKDLTDNGDYVNSREFPSLIKSSLVFENLGNKQLVIDIRSADEYRQGHIKGSVNKAFGDLPGYFESGIRPFEYDRIILVCEDGQRASYATCLLRLMGYGNVFAMRWGMGGWNNAFAKESWLKALSGNYENKLETSVNPMPPALSMPELRTGKTTGEEIAAARFAGLFSEGTGKVLISPDEVFSNPSGYYIMNYERKDKYEDGHIPGSVRYKPEATLGIVSEMATIPHDKTVVVYCGTGHNSGFVTAYLRLFGFDARTLAYGNNGFMHDRMVSRKTALSWVPFTTEDVQNFPVVK